jgi:hypothetical protein
MASQTKTIDDCALCLRRDVLQMSHVIPRGVYRRVSKDPRGSVNIVRNKAILTQSQLKVPLLCLDCEGRFSKYGENYFLAQCLQPNGAFPLLDRALLARHALTAVKGNTAYWKADQLGIDHAKIAYFAASLFWRTFAAKSKLPRERISLGLDSNFAEVLRMYLNSERQDLPGVMIKIDVFEGIPGLPHDHRYVYAMPQEVPHQFGPELRFYTAEALGFAFTMTTTSNPELIAAMNTNCFVHNPDHPLFLSQEMQLATATRQAAWIRRSAPTEHLRDFGKHHGT